jgi:hypothetical protein
MIDAASRLAPNTVLTSEMLLNGEKKATLSYSTAVWQLASLIPESVSPSEMIF